jgi:hypothetical protein
MSKIPNRQIKLDYASSLPRRRGAQRFFSFFAGVASLLGVALQFPWFYFSAYLTWAGVIGGSSDIHTGKRPQGILTDCFVLLPTIAALFLGFISVKFGGFSMRNVAGVVGLILSITLAVLIVIACFRA